MRTVTSATVLAVENGNLEGQLRASQKRVREVGAAERRRIERDLHDSVQQRLVALRINLELTIEKLHRHEHRAMHGFGAELDHVLEAVRAAASGVQPPGLREHGVATTLRSLARSAATPVAVEDRGFGRHSELVESTVFFCCAEALQNATKHAGPSAPVTVRLSSSDGWVQFSVEDQGIGFDPHTVARGRGLDNMTDRVSALGGSLVLDSAAGTGTRINRRLPEDV